MPFFQVNLQEIQSIPTRIDSSFFTVNHNLWINLKELIHTASNSL